MTAAPERAEPRRDERRAATAPVPRPPVPWRTRDAFAILGLTLASFVPLLLVAGMVGWRGEIDSPGGAVVMVGSFALPLLVTLAYLRLRFRADMAYLWRPHGQMAPRTLAALGVGLAVGAAWWVVVHVLGLAVAVEVAGIEPPDVQQPIQEAITTPGITMIAAWITVVLLAPVTEEIVFRGVLFLGLARWIGTIPAALVSSGVFGIIHYEESVTAWAFMAVLAFPFGLFACWLVHRFGSLWLPIGAHAGVNASTLAVATLVGDMV